MTARNVNHRALEVALLGLHVGQVGAVLSVTVHRVTGWEWSVPGGPAAFLLPAIDAVARRAGYAAAGEAPPVAGMAPGWAVGAPAGAEGYLFV
jgi:hypothetical protein